MRTKSLSMYRGCQFSSLTAKAAVAGAVLAMLGMTVGTASATPYYIYQDNFSGDGTASLAGAVPTVDHGSSTSWIEQWNSGYNLKGTGTGTNGGNPDNTQDTSIVPFWMNNGSITGSLNAGANGAEEAASLNFSPQPGYIYTLSAILNPATDEANLPSGQQGFMALGFISGAVMGTTGAKSPFLHGAGPIIQLNNNGTQQTYTDTFGGNTDTITGSGAAAPLNETAQVVLNTMAADWTVGFWYNGNQIGNTFTYTGTSGTNPNPVGISAVGIDGNGVTGTVNDFYLTPEPASLALMGAGALVLLLVGRKRRMRRSA
ncbi:MAG: PEP-CTERM sorting domain-containing protein [Phycisphaerae bacterium]